MKYKFAHFADIHWRGLSRHAEYRRSFASAFDSLREEEVDAIFVIGDIVHSKTQGISPELIDNLCWLFKSFANIAPTYITLGNHDGLILNKDREDAISPIIRALNLPNLHLIKKTEKVAYDDTIDISNFSCFYEDEWGNLEPTPGKTNIALFHGAVRGSKTDIDWEMDGEVATDMFSGYDFVFLGDIHKFQFLDDECRIGYCGSTIQQNYGESTGKGYLLWEIDDADSFSARHVEVLHDRPFVTINWMGTAAETLDESENYPDFSRFRIRTTEAISQGEIRQLYSSLKEFKNASEIVMKHEAPRTEHVLRDLDGKRINLREPKKVSAVIQKYFEKAQLSDRMNSRLDELVHNLWKTVMKSDQSPTGRWSLDWLEFDNTFGYGKGNSINFDNCEGITGIFGPNRTGKSSICGTIMYTLFNATDRGGISNLHVINSRKGHCKSRARISKSGLSFIVERQTVKKQSRSGKLSASTQLNLIQVDDDDNIIKDMCGEQRRETEKTLRSIVGTSDDFLLTTFAAQGEMNAFLKQKASSRKGILSKFLELDVFEKLNDAAREEISGVKQMLKNIPDRDFDMTIIDLRSKLKARDRDREALWEELVMLRGEARSLELTLATRTDSNLVTQEDIGDQAEKLRKLSKDRSDRSALVSTLTSELSVITEQSDRLYDFKESFPIEELKCSILEQRELESSVASIKHHVEKEKQKLKHLEKGVSLLSDVPCGSQFPTCQYIINANKAKKSLQSQQSTIDDLRDDLKATRVGLRKLLSKELEEKLEKYDSVMVKFNDISIKKSKTELSLTNVSNKLNHATEEFRRQTRVLDEMKANISNDDSAIQGRALRSKLKRMKDEISEKESSHASLSETIGLLQSDIQKMIKEKEKFDNLIEQWKVFELFLQATSKNGVPLAIIRSRLPEINSEIASILQGVTGFTVELESDEGSNEMTIYINYGDSRRIIECCSGMEKMMSALAIRVALINVSELPKSDMLIIDEGFGTLDSANIESCGRFLESLKKWFRAILVISHVDGIKDEVDNVLEIRKRANDAYISL